MTFIDELNDIRRRAGILEQHDTYPFEWHGKNIMWSNGRYFISVNDVSNPTYISIYDSDNNRIGNMSTGYKQYSGKLWISVRDVTIKKDYQGNRLGFLMYKILLDNMNPEWGGMLGYQPDIVNKRVHKIYKRLGAEDLEDYYVIPNPNK